MLGPFFMIDIETTGIEFENNQLLEIGIVEVNKTPLGRWQPGKMFHSLQNTILEPKSEFSKKFQQELFSKCKAAEAIPTFSMRNKILDFIRNCQVNPGPDLKFMGWNAAIFDLPFLCHFGYLDSPHHVTINGEDFPKGDFHYSIYDVNTALTFVADSMAITKEELKDILKGSEATIAYPSNIGKAHSALFDCYNQINTLNKLLELNR